MLAACHNNEPDFIVVGPPDIVAKVQVNIAINRDAREAGARRSSLETVFLDGKTKKIDYGKVYSYSVYIKYDNKLFGYLEHENFMHNLDPRTARNEISISRNGQGIYFQYITSTEGNAAAQMAPVKLLPKDDMIEFVLKEGEKNHVRYVNKQKFIENLKRSFDPINF